ncbi:MAG: hypothetical protein JWN46_1146 [Acidimicrobiales bacterium]|nr:hypothetical protein [Acidimicrobiales bacterium]
MERIVLFLVLAAAAGAVAWVLRRRSQDAPTQGSSWAVPAQLDRADFERPDAAWLVTVFSSATCLSCQATWEKARLLASGAVAVQEVEAVEHRPLHQRYGVEAVPMVLVSDTTGAVRASFVGEPSATDLWAAVAELREPGSTPEGCDHGQPGT